MTIRLARFLARAGETSRRGAADLVASGRVRVNGSPPRGPGDPVDPATDTVTVDGRPVRPAALSWILLHKPTGYITSRAGSPRFTPVFDLLPDAGESLVAVGRLDVMSEGVLLLTTDGDLAARLMHPRHQIPRAYQALVSGCLDHDGLAGLRRGLPLEGGAPVIPTRVRFTRDRAGGTLELELTEGRNRVVRKVCAALGLTVRRLVRTAYGPVGLGDLPGGSWRPLTIDEVTALYRAVDLPAPGITR